MHFNTVSCKQIHGIRFMSFKLLHIKYSPKICGNASVVLLARVSSPCTVCLVTVQLLLACYCLGVLALWTVGGILWQPCDDNVLSVGERGLLDHLLFWTLHGQLCLLTLILFLNGGKITCCLLLTSVLTITFGKNQILDLENQCNAHADMFLKYWLVSYGSCWNSVISVGTIVWSWIRRVQHTKKCITKFTLEYQLP